MSNSIIEALSKPALDRDALARDLAAYATTRANTSFKDAASYLNRNPEYALEIYAAGMEWEAKAARILQSVVFQREPEFTRAEREALLRLIGGES